MPSTNIRTPPIKWIIIVPRDFAKRYVYIGLVNVYPQKSFIFCCHTGGKYESSTVSNILRFSLAFVLRASRPFLAIIALYPEFFDLYLKCRQYRNAVRCMYMYICKRRVYSPLRDAVAFTYLFHLFQGRR